MLKPQDVLIVLKIVALGRSEWTHASLGSELSISPSEVHSGLERARRSHLVTPSKRHPVKAALSEFLCHGVRYAFPAETGGETRGLPTATGAMPLIKLLPTATDLLPVWPFPEGNTRGFAFEPLYRTVPQAASKDDFLYELLALVDGIRGGRARERALAAKELCARLEDGSR